MTTPVLGLNFGTHDAAAAVVHEGRVIAAVEEERLTRIKHTKAFPSHAIAYCLAEAGLAASEVDQVALFVDPKLQLLLAPANLWHGFPAALGSLYSDLDKYRKRRRLPVAIRASGVFRPGTRVIPVPHHRAHAASAYLTSPFDDALVVTLDGRGEYETACVYDGRGGRLYPQHRVVYPHSFGYLYSMLTRFLGFRPQRDEYKVMDLAAHGTPTMVSRIAAWSQVVTATV
ncbi:MAG: carbamoyltransferase N-terminal domain-containing protein [Pseudonocardiaceae bacterium]